MKFSFAPLASVVLAAGAANAGVAEELPSLMASSGTPGTFDFYLLAQSWQPQFCHGKESQYPGCKNPEEWMKTHFTLHGLWPEYKSGSYPQNCKSTTFDAKTVENAVGMGNLTKYWPEVEYDVSSSQYPTFWEHEWSRHGSCTGLDQRTYFAVAVSMLRDGLASTPDFIQKNVGKTVSTADLRAAYGANTPVLKCSGKYLSQVFTCWEKNSKNNIPTTGMACPAAVLKEDTCKGTSVSLQAFA
ncbi:hypothetical protein Poli38472_012718 [Pythium oligandrum]|uniref:Uncharacterized protein n=1 Tax=Pythium oligandrum TaxID=41045 RepID=A0A8K1CG39_PYTOL|nr:hypothetical protein Poli38472_012718 [Pythium oligandrum]|eukprot:TMW61527.1 hypothetical protein Poli38472_012718 [Pythium oligandrum]